eukprot:SAG11_NODE_751_length_7356_cov_33.908227_4_plen_70_part_00
MPQQLHNPPSILLALDPRFDIVSTSARYFVDFGSGGDRSGKLNNARSRHDHAVVLMLYPRYDHGACKAF